MNAEQLFYTDLNISINNESTNNATSNGFDPGVGLDKDFLAKKQSYSLEINTFDDATSSRHHSPPLSSSSTPSASSVSCHNSKISELLDPTENYEIALRKLDILLEKLNWSVRAITNNSCVNIGTLLSDILKTNNETSFLLFADSFLECTNCRLSIDLSRVVQEIKHIYETFAANASVPFNLNLLINKSTMSLIDLVINCSHECSNIANKHILDIEVEHFLRDLELNLSNSSALNRKKSADMRKCERQEDLDYLAKSTILGEEVNATGLGE